MQEFCEKKIVDEIKFDDVKPQIRYFSNNFVSLQLLLLQRLHSVEKLGGNGLQLLMCMCVFLSSQLTINLCTFVIKCTAVYHAFVA